MSTSMNPCVILFHQQWWFTVRVRGWYKTKVRSLLFERTRYFKRLKLQQQLKCSKDAKPWNMFLLKENNSKFYDFLEQLIKDNLFDKYFSSQTCWITYQFLHGYGKTAQIFWSIDKAKALTLLSLRRVKLILRQSSYLSSIVYNLCLTFSAAAKSKKTDRLPKTFLRKKREGLRYLTVMKNVLLSINAKRLLVYILRRLAQRKRLFSISFEVNKTRFLKWQKWLFILRIVYLHQLNRNFS